MSIIDFVKRVQRELQVAAAAGILLLQLSLILVILGIGAFVGAGDSKLAIVLGVFSLAAFAFSLWRIRALLSRANVALWIEELVPALHYGVVTLVELGSPIPEIEKTIQLGAISPAVRKRITRSMARALALVAFSTAVYFLSPATTFGRTRVHSGLARAFPRVVSAMDKTADVRIRITPPAYTHTSATIVTNAPAVKAVAGSTLQLLGNGSPEGVSVTLDDKPVKVLGDESSWSAQITPAKPVALLRIQHLSRQRLTIVETVADSAPKVTLTSPLRDTTLRTPRFRVSLSAETSDDLGLSAGYFEYLIVSGSGEAFNGRTVTSQVFQFDSRTGGMQAMLDLESHKIGAGDLVSVRAIVRDNNSFSGPSTGVSDTRTFRVARADEYDSVSIEAAAPPPVDSSAMSQRMLIIMTEALVKKQKTLSRQQLVKESDDIGFLEDRIRKRVYDILYQTDSPDGPGDTEEAESELQAINNPDLKEAYDALWDAVRSLRIAEPAAALPPMRIALKALDRARLAQRLYLRGGAPRVVVDVARVRLTGKDKGSSSRRTAQFAADSVRHLLAEEFQAAMRKRGTGSRQAIEDLSLLRVRALQNYPEAARALGEVIDLLQTNRPVDAALARVRKALDDPHPGIGSPLEWGGG
jgi:hypothetical protein